MYKVECCSGRLDATVTCYSLQNQSKKYLAIIKTCRPHASFGACEGRRHMRLLTTLHRPSAAQHLSAGRSNLQPVQRAAPKSPLLQLQTQAARLCAYKVTVASAGAVEPCSAVAMDLEYSHLLLEDGNKVVVPAWVALVDNKCSLLVKTYIRPEFTNIKRSSGGVPYALCAAAPSLSSVRQQLQQLLANKLLVGHGLSKDLAALGLQHPRSLQYDTITYPPFCNKAGNARNLKTLAKQHLDLDIQCEPRNPSSRTNRSKRQQKAQHDPEEDAVAVMKLYQQVVVPSTYEGQVEAETQQLILNIRRQQGLALMEASDC